MNYVVIFNGYTELYEVLFSGDPDECAHYVEHHRVPKGYRIIDRRTLEYG